ncbi:MAG TPA: hypothetical protein VEY08_05975, partial [Chloroflexia bacterium]|nr:hypothetical protein [Chloroflexia bacterium]
SSERGRPSKSGIRASVSASATAADSPARKRSIARAGSLVYHPPDALPVPNGNYTAAPASRETTTAPGSARMGRSDG